MVAIPLIKIRHNFFKITFFLPAIIECNKLDPTIWNAEVFSNFKTISSILLDPSQDVFLTDATTKELEWWYDFI